MKKRNTITRREALRRGLFGTAGVVLADRLSGVVHADTKATAPLKAKAKSAL